MEGTSPQRPRRLLRATEPSRSARFARGRASALRATGHPARCQPAGPLDSARISGDELVPEFDCAAPAAGNFLRDVAAAPGSRGGGGVDVGLARRPAGALA